MSCLGIFCWFEIKFVSVFVFFYFIFCRFYVNFITSEYVAVCFPLFFYDSFHFFCLYLFTVFLIYFMLNKPFYYSIKVLQTIIFLYFSIFLFPCSFYYFYVSLFFCGLVILCVSYGVFSVFSKPQISTNICKLCGKINVLLLKVICWKEHGEKCRNKTKIQILICILLKICLTKSKCVYLNTHVGFLLATV